MPNTEQEPRSRQRRIGDRRSVQGYVSSKESEALDSLCDSTGLTRAYWVRAALRSLLRERNLLDGSTDNH